MSFSQKSHENLRRVNFSQSEKVLLVSLIEKNKTWILDNPFLVDGVTSWRKKSEVWEEISKNFNVLTQSQIHRNARQLRKCWENLKSRYRKVSRDQQPSMCESGIAFSAQGGSGRLETDDSALHRRVGILVSLINQQRINVNSMMPQNDLPAMEKSSATVKEVNSPDMLQESNESDLKRGHVENCSMQPLLRRQSPMKSDDDVSIVKVTSILGSNSKVLPTKSADFANQSPLEEAAELRFDKTSQRNTKHPSERVSRRNVTGNSVFRNGLKGETSLSRMRASPFARFNHVAQNRPQSVDTEKLLRIRYLRNRVREQELKLRMMQQKMQMERERHEAAMALLHKQSAHFQNRIDRLQDQFNDDEEFCEDWLINVT